MPETDTGQGGLNSERLLLPALIWRKLHSLGEISYVIRPENEAIIVKRTTVRVSLRIKQPLLILKSGESVVLTKRRNCPHPDDVDGVLFEQGDSETRTWISHRLLQGQSEDAAWLQKRNNVLASWRIGIRYAAEQLDDDGDIKQPGLRPPQIGALHAIGAHWSLYKTPATVVMPTGTGKTETMIAALVGEVRGTLLVVVPSSALRIQTQRKFLTLGLLRAFKVVPSELQNPIVGTITKRPRSSEELDIFKICNVVITTMAAVSQGTAVDLIPEMSNLMDTLIVDEAHHVGAKSWSAFRERFSEQRVLQFTATPYRRDGVIVDGDVIYSYPLRRAQEDNYFKPIQFAPVCEIEGVDADRAIATKAVKQLKADLDRGLDHLVMARCNSISRAEKVLTHYQEFAPQYQPILVHSKNPSSSHQLESLYSRASRVVVCVEMLGEGFDLPHLKVAAIHDTHKSLAVLLQFTGRFTRSSDGRLGDATVIANIADQDVSAGLERLYSEDADWNHLLAELSSDAVREHRELVEFLAQSVSLSDENDDVLTPISPALLRPKFSTVAYRAARFNPRRFYHAVASSVEVHRVWLHEESNTLYFVTKSEPPVLWTCAKAIRDREWNLFVVHYDYELRILFIHSSDKSSLHDGLAKAVCGQDVTLIRGDPIFRTLAGVNRLQFQNIGITRHARRNLRYAMYTGADVKQALDISQTAGSTKSVLQGTGYENGFPVAVGCSIKGRVWSKEGGPIGHLTRWCKEVGAKLINENISTDQIIDNVMVPVEVDQFPDVTVLTLDWPIEILKHQEERVHLRHGETNTALSSFNLILDEVAPDRRTMKFYLEYEDVRSDYEFRLGIENAYAFKHVSGVPLLVVIGRRETALASFLLDYPLLIRFVDLSELDGHLLFRPEATQDITFPAERFEVWDWGDVDVRKESLWKNNHKRSDSVQALAANCFIDKGFDIVFDDDGPGEAADLICFKMDEDTIEFALIHCKFSETVGGARVSDAVEVCSQAVRSGRWVWKFKDLCRHILRREQRLRSDIRSTRFLNGSSRDIHNIIRASRFKEIRAEIVIVQPGISRTRHTNQQATVLASAHCFLNETVDVPLAVVCAN